jgi:diketogulonate reductase-like aldo/keto reductase
MCRRRVEAALHTGVFVAMARHDGPSSPASYTSGMTVVLPSRNVQGVSVPSFFYGTAWKEERTRTLTALALEAGFRAIDTANQRRHYFEAAVGDAVKSLLGSGTIARSGLFLQSKFTFAAGQDHRLPYDRQASIDKQVLQSLQSSLDHFGTAYLDSVLLHGPSTRHGLNDEDWEAWRAMEALKLDGKARLIGVSNMSAEQLELLFARAKVKPAFVQNRCYARTGWDREVRALAKAHDIVYQGFSLLTANAREVQGSTIKGIAARHGRTEAQVVFRFALEVGMIPLTGTTDRRHMQEDLGAFEFALDPEEVAAIEMG